ncbi:Ung1p [Sugiyamaella lignohabitans]|uniref:Uracil-DNA glycosylase n=1 Tax=Sugiyamaella lignohabitans TaxID=796027 RepID=A0A161HK53_9ASCO|nr:Ung1p [Sugiyamaella lignohabitans]ANB11948.1 Ung1p [Sugiyamaella lignohabitans]
MTFLSPETNRQTVSRAEILTRCRLEITTLDESWLAVLHKELSKPYFLNLKKFIKTEINNGKRIFPPLQDIYSWSRHTPLDSVRVVILGQDPYHGPNQAHGLAFSVNPPTPPPPSLRNIYKGIAIDYPDFVVPKSGLLTPWANRGVLLLNTCLTVQAANANSHAGKGWETFTEEVLKAAVKARPSGICFLAWGNPAYARMQKIRPSSEHLVLRSVHPSPLSASRGFFECNHFRKANEWLFEKYGPAGVVDWALQTGNKLQAIELLLDPAKQQQLKELETLLADDDDEDDDEIPPTTTKN